MKYYRPKYFKSYELVSRGIYEQFGYSSLMFLDPRILWTIDAIRQYFNKPITVNNWMWKKDGFTYRGYREPSVSIGATYSQHKMGRAIDFNMAGLTPQEVYEDVISNYNAPRYQHITAIEEPTTWVHIDCRNYKNVSGPLVIHQ